jgi:hypothetical protein
MDVLFIVNVEWLFIEPFVKSVVYAVEILHFETQFDTLIEEDGGMVTGKFGVVSFI